MSADVPKDRARILVVGDSGVGKTTLVHKICHNALPARVGWTCGVNIDAFVYDFAATEKSVILEFWDVGGSSSFRQSRSTFYSHINGILLVYDMNNIKSYVNLKSWLKEVLATDPILPFDQKAHTVGNDAGTPPPGAPNPFIPSKPGVVGVQATRAESCGIPILVVGTKADLRQDRRSMPTLSWHQGVGADHVTVSAGEMPFTPGIMDSFSLFFDRAVTHRTMSPAGRGGANRKSPVAVPGYAGENTRDTLDSSRIRERSIQSTQRGPSAANAWDMTHTRRTEMQADHHPDRRLSGEVKRA